MYDHMTLVLGAWQARSVTLMSLLIELRPVWASITQGTSCSVVSACLRCCLLMAYFKIARKQTCAPDSLVSSATSNLHARPVSGVHAPLCLTCTRNVGNLRRAEVSFTCRVPGNALTPPPPPGTRKQCRKPEQGRRGRKV